MKLTDKERIRLTEAFRQIYRNRTAPELDEAWQLRTMNRIRALPIVAKIRNPFTELVWKISPAIAVLLVALSLFMFSAGYNPFIQSVDLVTNYTLSYGYEQLFSGY